MDQTDRDTIQSNFIALSESISDDIKLLTKDLQSRKLVSKSMADSVLQKNDTDMERAMALLELVPTRGTQAYDTLYTSCLSRELWEAADILRPDNKPHGPDILPASQPSPGQGADQGVTPPVKVEPESSDEEPMPDVWPPSAAPNLVAMKVFQSSDLGAEKEKKYKQKYINAHTTKGLGLNYSMKRGSPNRGLVFVINNEEFVTLNKRDGTNRDMSGIAILFQKLGFRVQEERNLTKEKMWEKCVEMSQKDFGSYDCFMMFVLTHGYRGVVFGTDGNADEIKNEGGQVTSVSLDNFLEISKITDLFCHVESLQGKPKLFFIQACQGSGKDKGKPVIVPESPDSATPTGNVDSPAAALNYLAAEEHDSIGEKRPSRADIFIAMATTPDTVSWRRPDFGSWFIQALIEVLARYAYKFEFQHLMTRVNGLLSRAVTKTGGYKQIMEKKDTFQKKLYFHPGLENPDDMQL